MKLNLDDYKINLSESSRSINGRNYANKSHLKSELIITTFSCMI